MKKNNNVRKKKWQEKVCPSPFEQKITESTIKNKNKGVPDCVTKKKSNGNES